MLFYGDPDVMKRNGQWGKKSANENMSCMRPRNNGLVDAGGPHTHCRYVQEQQASTGHRHIDQVSENLISNATAHVSALLLRRPVGSLVKIKFMDCLDSI